MSRLLRCKRIDGLAVERALHSLIRTVERRSSSSSGDQFELEFLTGFRGKTWRGQRVHVSLRLLENNIVQAVVRSRSRVWQPIELGEPQEVAELVMDHLVQVVEGVSPEAN